VLAVEIVLKQVFLKVEIYYYWQILCCDSRDKLTLLGYARFTEPLWSSQEVRFNTVVEMQHRSEVRSCWLKPEKSLDFR